MLSHQIKSYFLGFPVTRNPKKAQMSQLGKKKEKFEDVVAKKNI